MSQFEMIADELQNSSGRKIGRFDGSAVRDENGRVVGRIDGNYLRDDNGGVLASFDGTNIRGPNGEQIGNIDEVRSAIDGPGGFSVVAMWLLFVR